MATNDADTQDLSGVHSCLEVALAYIAAGIDVTPIHPPNANVSSPGKHPLLPAWQDRRLTADEFRGVFYRDCNIGVVTGKRSGIVCLDLDKAEGRAWFYENEYRLGHYVRERRGELSTHLYYRYPAGVDRVPSKDLLPRVQVKADNGHQVVTWPSVHKEGEQYLFDNGLTLLDVAHEADEFPRWILDILLTRETRLAESGGDKATALLDHPADVRAVREILSRMRPAVEGHSGDSQTYAAACVPRDYGLSEATAFALLVDLYNPRCLPPWSEADLKAKVRNAYKYAKGAAASKSIANEFPPVDPDAAEESVPVPPEVQEALSKVFRRLKDVRKMPYRMAEDLLLGLSGRLKVRQDRVYFYDIDANVWQMLDPQQVRSLVYDLVAQDYPDDAAECFTTTHTGNLVKALCDLVAREPFAEEENAWLDGHRDGNYLRLENGILDIKSRELLGHTKDWFSLTKLPFGYDPEAACPAFERFLGSVWGGDADVKAAFQLWLGYLLLSDTAEQKFAVLIGASRAGKGVMTRLMERLIGKANSTSCSMTTLSNPHGLAALVGKRLAVFPDAFRPGSRDVDVATERLISITGNDSQLVNPKGTAMYSAVLPVKIVLACNEMPTLVNNRSALTNRMVLFPFTESFAGREDTRLEERLQAELPGILNWALDGACKLLAGQRLVMPESAREPLEQIHQELDSVYAFVAERVRPIPDFVNDAAAKRKAVTFRQLYDAYRAFCVDNNRQAKSAQRFSKSFKEHTAGVIVEDRTPRTDPGERQRVYPNLRLLELGQEFEDGEGGIPF